MTDEQLLQTIMSTKSMWGKINEKDTPALYNFLEGIIDTCKSRKLGIDIKDTKCVAKNTYTRDVVVETLLEYNYKFLPEYFRKIGFPQANDVFSSLSMHKPLTPDVIEIKKLQLLEKAVGVVHENITSELKKYLKNAPEIKFDFKNGTDTFWIEQLCDALGLDIHRWTIRTQLGKIAGELSTALKNAFNNSSSTGNYDKLAKLTHLISRISCNGANGNIDVRSLEYIKTLQNLLLITSDDIKRPRFIFDRTKEIAQNTLGEAITKENEYLGHWVDREYLKNASFNQILGTWLHEICHKSGGDGTSEFTYTLTDMLRVLLAAGGNNQSKAKLAAIEEIYNKLNQNIC